MLEIRVSGASTLKYIKMFNHQGEGSVKRDLLDVGIGIRD